MADANPKLNPEMSRTAKYVQHRTDGTIYEWNEIMAAHPKMETVSAATAYPEWFIPEKQQGRKAKVDMTSELPDEEAPVDNSALAASPRFTG